MQDIVPNEVGSWQQRGAKIVDVREPQAYAGGHLPGAVNIPLAGLTLTPELRASPVVVVCASGGRSARAAAMLGGTFGWLQDNRPTEFAEADLDDRF